MPNFTGKSGGGPHHMKKYGQGKSPIMNLGFIKAKTLKNNPDAKTMMVDGKEMPITKGGPKMKYGSPMEKDTGEVVSKTSPGSGWTKTKGTNIWAPPKNDGKGLGLVEKKGLVKKSNKTITDNKSMKPPYKKPVGPRA